MHHYIMSDELQYLIALFDSQSNTIIGIIVQSDVLKILHPALAIIFWRNSRVMDLAVGLNGKFGVMVPPLYHFDLARLLF